MKEKKYKQDEFFEFVEKELDRITDYSNPSFITEIYKSLYITARESELSGQIKVYKNYYIDKLLDLGMREKEKWHELGKEAETMFIKAINLDQFLPIAHYRLGHIVFKRENYVEAIKNFDKALELQSNQEVKSKRLLDNIQIMTAKKMAAYSSIKLLEKYFDESLEHDKYSNLNTELRKYSQAINPGIEMLKMKKNGEKYEPISSEDYKDFFDDNPDYLIIDRYAEENRIGYKGREEKVENQRLGFLVEIIEQRYGNHDASFSEEFHDNLVNTNRQYIRRVNKEFVKVGLRPEEINIVYSSKGNKQKVEFINNNIPMVIFKRIFD